MKCKLFLLSVFLSCAFQISAQQIVTGVVKDQTGEPLVGVTIVVVDTSIGEITDFDGKYAIKPGNKSGSLRFTYLGMKNKTIPINGQNVINVVMETENSTLDEVLLIGYGQSKKSDLTGSMSSIKTELTEQRAVSSAEQLLQGTMPGVQITTTGGAPGSNADVNIRGGNSLTGSNQPLYIIDGMEMNNSDSFYSEGTEDYGSTPAPSPLSMINPNDIESINVLKDASATAIYGSRGANGVILITTKQGKSGEKVIQLDVGTTFSTIRDKIDVITPQQWTQLYDEASINDGPTNLPVFGDPNDLSTYETYNYDINWQDELYRLAIGNDINLSVRGGTDNFKYSIAANHNEAEGVIIKSDQKRNSIRSNLEAKVSNSFKVGINSNFSSTVSNIVPYSNNGTNGFFSPISMAVQYRAFNPTWVQDLDVNVEDLINDNEDETYNPITQINNIVDEQRLYFAQSKLFGIFEINDWLTFKSTFGFNFSNSIRNSFWGEGTYASDRNNGVVSRVENSNFDYINENTLSFNKKINNNHRLNGVVGQTIHKWIRKSFRNKASGFDIPTLGYESFVGAAITGTPISSHKEWGLASYYGRLNYTISNKYLFTFTGRYDGSSKFAEGNKWSFFPSAAFAWRMKNEQFLKNEDWLSALKLRLSYGTSGNQAISPLATVAQLAQGGRYPINGTIETGVTSSSYQFNNDLKWETTYQGNVGLDIGLFQNRLNVTADYYKKNTKDLLLDKTFPLSSGFSSTTVNGGEIENKGWELFIEGDIIKKENITWNIGVSLSQNKSKVIDLDGDPYRFGPGVGGLQSGAPNISYLGRTVGLFYGYQTNGIYQSAADVVDAPTRSSVAPNPGDIIYIDQDDNGEINDEDKVVIGNPEPDLIYGINTTFTYKRFSVNMLFNGMLGNDVFNLNKITWEGMNIWDGRYSQTLEAFNGRWVDENTPATYPRASLGAVNPDYLDRYVEDGSFLRLQNISLSYTWRPNKKSPFSLIRPYVSVSNLFIISNYSGYDPEVKGIVNTPLAPGIDLGSYPLPRTFKLGFSIILK
ncbi:hypothetical protein APS56_04580 [Pseudalgibacter alginicilyticus]|uniref:TonB-dependent receptor plug domain-containing protein n=1 Tax=Pseudalgibacter alginicilyticus TaxID=1736674 RepID=A0A0P0D3D6_9FLAO|nr:TonB-dependent receptor [Pseudalgibacter alginicilyticus]ALJ04459.1 hypothetical protein APS56_04580 [Pseudalgibacter alginicilyticus]